MDNLSFCGFCGSLMPTSEGELRKSPTGQVEAVCNECLPLDQASPQSPNAGPGESQVCSGASSAASIEPG